MPGAPRSLIPAQTRRRSNATFQQRCAGPSHPATYPDPMPTPPHAHRSPDVETAELFGGTEKRDIVIAPPDPAWPRIYQDHERRIRAALGTEALSVEHIGSTSVPGLPAKPIIDILVVVDDLTAEEDYRPQLEAAGYPLRVREPGHRMVRTPQRDVHVHILEQGDEQIEEYLLFRDRLRADETDRGLYARTKRQLAARDWPDMNAYADAKTEVISQIKEHARHDRP